MEIGTIIIFYFSELLKLSRNHLLFLFNTASFQNLRSGVDQQKMIKAIRSLKVSRLGENRVKTGLAPKFCIAFLILLSYTTTLAVNAEYTVGVKPGDTMKYDISYSGPNPEAPGRTEWSTIEILSVTGTTVTYRQTDHLFDGTEMNRTTSEIANGTASATQSGFFIPANSKAGDTISTISGTSPVMITGETTQTYAGAGRMVVWAKYSFMNIQFTNYWDKEKGILVESEQIAQNQDLSDQKLTETNLWKAESSFQLGWWLWVVIAAAAAVIISIVLVQRARKTKTQTETKQATRLRQ